MDWTIWDALLEELYTEDEARRWLTSPHPMLGGITPAEELAKDNSHKVWDCIEALNQDQIAT
jgi:uncharacterized protein (DUF2384 family)